MPCATSQALVGALSPLFEERCYASGGLLACEGDPADTLFYVEEGTAQICFSRKQRPDEDLVDSEVGAGPALARPKGSSAVRRQLTA